MKLLFRYFLLILGVICCKAQFNTRDKSKGGVVWAPTLEDDHQTDSGIHDAFLDNCRENGGEAAVSSFMQAGGNFGQCISALVIQEEFGIEFIQSKNNGDLRNFFKKYCRKVPEFKKCLKHFSKEVDSCYTEKEKKVKAVMVKVYYDIADFICYKEGKRSSAFISDGGQECIQENAFAIQTCMESTVTPYMKMIEKPQDIFKNAFGKRHCLAIKKFQSCVAKALQLCRKPTITQFFDDAIDTVMKSSPCRKYISGNGGYRRLSKSPSKDFLKLRIPHSH